MTDKPAREHPGAVADAGGDVPDYPADLEHWARLRDGRKVFIRPIRPSDADQLRQAIETADFETLHARFLGSPPHDDASIRRLVEVDYRSRMALVAFAPDGTGVGIARYEGNPDSVAAEVAVVVDKDWRRVGLGSLLLREIGAAAVDRGISRFTALALAENAGAVGVLKESGLEFSLEIDDATANIVIGLPVAGLPRNADPLP